MIKYVFGPRHYDSPEFSFKSSFLWLSYFYHFVAFVHTERLIDQILISPGYRLDGLVV